MSPKSARLTAQRWLGSVQPRWAHVCAVSEVAERIACESGQGGSVVEAAWLHDIGYASGLSRTGFHPLDGATYLATCGFSPEVVGLVAFHTGAEFEAQQRGLEQALMTFQRPDQDQLDALTLSDLCVSPEGTRVHPADRIAEILQRYPPSDPVHRAVIRSQDYLLASARRAAVATGSPDEWGFSLT